MVGGRDPTTTLDFVHDDRIRIDVTSEHDH